MECLYKHSIFSIFRGEGRMIERVQLFPINFYKKETFHGSDGNMCFRLGKMEIEENEEKKTVLRGVVWEGPFCFASTPEEKKEYRDFSFSDDGIRGAMDWFNEKSSEYNSLSGV